MRRTLSSLVVVAVVLGPATTALGQSEEEVAEAAQLAEDAAASLDRAGEYRADAAARLAAAFREYQTLTTRITDVSLDLAATIEATLTKETTHRTLRDEARRQVVAAYVGGSPPPRLLATPDLTMLAFADRVRTTVAEVRTGHFREFDASTADLETERAALEGTRAELARLRDAATALVPEMERLLAATEIQEAFWVTEHEAAVAAHELELAELEAALARVSPRALLWRDLIADHFPEAMHWAALQVLDCESAGDPDAVNEMSGSVGLFQFLEGTWLFASAGAGFAGADRTDPEANVAAAAWLVARSETLDHPRGAWGHWVCQPDVELLGGG